MKIEEHHYALVLGSDGLFESLTLTEVAQIVLEASKSSSSSNTNEQHIAQLLCHESRERGVRDDISCIVVFLK